MKQQQQKKTFFNIDIVNLLYVLFYSHICNITTSKKKIPFCIQHIKYLKFLSLFV